MCRLCKVYLQYNIKHKMNYVNGLVKTKVSPQNKSRNERERYANTRKKKAWTGKWERTDQFKR